MYNFKMNGNPDDIQGNIRFEHPSPFRQGHLVVHIYFISVDTFYEIGLDFHALSRKNVNIRKLKSKAEPKTK